MFCVNCGQQLSDEAKFCTTCGRPVNPLGPTPGETATHSSMSPSETSNSHTRSVDESIPSTEITDQELSAVVGSRADYYLRKWSLIDPEKPLVKGTWNWPAFFFTIFWFLYRKMYLYAIVLVIVDLVAVLLSYRGSVMGIIVSVLSGRMANGLYFMFAKNRIRKIKSTHPNREKQLSTIASQGGTSVPSWIIGAIVYVAVAIGIMLLKGSSLLALQATSSNQLTVGTHAHKDQYLSVSGQDFVAGGPFYFNIIPPATSKGVLVEKR